MRTSPDGGKICSLELSAYVSRQTRKSHSGGRRFDPAERDQLHRIVQVQNEMIARREAANVTISLIDLRLWGTAVSPVEIRLQFRDIDAR